MVNYFKQRNFDGHLDKGYFVDNSINTEPKHLNASNALYDQNAGLTHAFLHTNKGQSDDEVRLIGDVEICMSNAPEVTSVFSTEYRNRLRMGLVDTKSATPSGLTDEQLMESVPCNVQFERDEIASFSKTTIGALDREAKLIEKYLEKDSPSSSPSPNDSPTPPTPADS